MSRVMSRVIKGRRTGPEVERACQPRRGRARHVGADVRQLHARRSCAQPAVAWLRLLLQRRDEHMGQDVQWPRLLEQRPRVHALSCARVLTKMSFGVPGDGNSPSPSLSHLSKHDAYCIVSLCLYVCLSYRLSFIVAQTRRAAQTSADLYSSLEMTPSSAS